MHKIPKRRLASNNGGPDGARSLLTLADEDADAPQGRADRQGVAVEAEQKQRLGTEEGRGDQGGQLLGGERAERAVAALGLAGHLGEQGDPAAEQLADGRADLGIGPPGGHQLLEHPDVAGLQVVLEEVAGLLVPLPQGPVLGVHVGLAGQALLVLHREQGQDESALGAEVVVQLAQRHPGLLGHLSGRQAGVAVGQHPDPGGVEDASAGIDRHVHHGTPLVDTTSVGRTTDLDIHGCWLHTPRSSVDRPRREQRCRARSIPRSTGVLVRRWPPRLSGWPMSPPTTGPARPTMPWRWSTATRPRRPTARWLAGQRCPRPVTSCTTSAGTPAPRRCAMSAMATTASRWSGAIWSSPGCGPRASMCWTPSPTPTSPSWSGPSRLRSWPPRPATPVPTPSTAAPGGSLCSTWAEPTATTAPAGSPCWTTTPSTSSAPGSTTAATSTSPTTAGGTCTTTP